MQRLEQPMTTTRLPRIDIPEAEEPQSADVSEILKTGNLPTRFAPGVSRWMTWGFVAVVTAVPLIDAGSALVNAARPQVVELFLRTPSRRNLERFEKRLEKSSTARQFVQPRTEWLLAGFHTTVRKPPAGPTSEHEFRFDGAKSPFIGPGEAGLVLHPFIGHTSVQTNVAAKVDYFGFRNDNSQIYFERPAGKLVVITGNSEAVGLYHRRSIAECLEQKLNERSREKWTVLNLAMNSYTIAYEIGAYTFLAYRLRPEYVISHSFYLDAEYGLRVPTKFQQLGLNYCPQVEDWYPNAHNRVLATGTGWQNRCEDGGPLAEAFLHNARKYRDIVHGNHGQFILGVQGFKQEAGYLHARVLPAIGAAYKELLGKLPGTDLNYLDFTRGYELPFVDQVHTADAAAAIVAEAYCNYILRHARETVDSASR